MKTMLMICALLMMAGSALAAPVDPTQPSGIAAQVNVAVPGTGAKATVIVLTTAGDILWLVRNPVESKYEWAWRSGFQSGWPTSVPVPVCEITDWTPLSFVMESGVVYIWLIDWGWRLLGEPDQLAPLPGFTPVVPVPSPMGELK